MNHLKAIHFNSLAKVSCTQEWISNIVAGFDNTLDDI